MTGDAAADLHRVLEIPRLGIHRVPTPLERRAVAEGRTIWIKRDDQCGFGRGGVKARKIDFYVRDLLDRGCDHLVTLAANVTNLVHDLAPLLREHGIGWTIYVTDDPPMPAALRARLFRDFDGGVRLLGAARAGAAARVLGSAAAARLRGQRPAIVLPSLGHPAAVAGVARGFLEAAEQMKGEAGAPPRTLFITAASGVTLAGLVLGERLLRATGAPPVHIVAVPVYSGPVRAYAAGLLRWTVRRYALASDADLAGVTITDWREGGDFGRFGAPLIALCERVDAEQQLKIDPIYGGKTWQTMERMIAEGTVEEPCLYWHCGYTPDWREFPVSP
jgi:1-aminocyclopropane-1-carboxylate deaminase/D-cysteine desulfhydrase-like pyridoxal-dependent ACC family enzyme